MRLLLLLSLALVLGVRSVILDPEDSANTEVIDLQENDGEQQPVSRTFFLLQLLKQKLRKLEQAKQVLPDVPCSCMPFYLCAPNGAIIADGSGVIDFRQVRQCVNAAEICCFLRTTNPTIPTTTTMTPLPTTLPPIITIPMTIQTIPTTQPPMTTVPLPTTQQTPSPTIRTTPPPVQTSPTVPPTTIPPNQQFCICIPIFQCALNSGFGVTAAPGNIDPRQQLVSNCIGIFVCCSNAGPQTSPAATLPPFTLPTTIPTTLPPPTTTTPLPTSLLPALNLQQNCLCVLLAACGLGYVPLASLNNIDPRMIVPRQGQSCSANSVCCRLGAASTALAQPAVQSSALVKFGGEDIKNAGSPNACRCVPVDNCPEVDTVSYDIDGTIDPRLGPCMSPVLVCCRLEKDTIQRSESEVAVIDPNPAAYIVTDSIVLRENVAACGIRDTAYASITSPMPGTAYFAEFPWMALISIRQPGVNDVVLCGGSLINSRVVVTAAHCVATCDPRTLVARLGEWDTSRTTEPLPYQEFGVQSVLVHPQFNPSALYFDVALVVLNRAVTYTPNIRPICLAAQGQVTATSTVCFASGWGASAFGTAGQYQTVLRKVALPIIDNASCQTRLRATRLGQFFQLHPSFICAGGQAKMDTCTKDGGGPLVCQDATGRFTQVGIVSWGIGCGSAAPAAYASVAQFRQWIDQQVLALGVFT